MRKLMRFCAVVALLALLTVMPASSRSQNAENGGENPPPSKDGVVYVCACLKTKSCFCMTEAKMAGPCACGTAGGPPMKAVPSNSAWAKENRKALSK